MWVRRYVTVKTRIIRTGEGPGDDYFLIPFVIVNPDAVPASPAA